MTSRIGAAAAAFLAAAALVSAAPSTPPAPERWVTDNAGFLSENVRRTLDARLEAFQGATGHQVLVWIDRTTGDTPIEDFAVRAFQAWKVGRRGLDDGLALFLMTEDRKVRFEVGYGLEDRVPDVVAFRIIREVMAPRLQAGDRDGAVQAGVEAALVAIGGAPEGGSRRTGRPAARPLTTAQKFVVGIVVLGFLILFLSNPSLALWLLANIASGADGRRGGGWGGGGGGGGFSGGGGRSGGGGATGSW